MSRPKPTVLLETIDKKTYKADQVLKAEAIWAVFYPRSFLIQKKKKFQTFPQTIRSNIKKLVSQSYCIKFSKKVK